MAKKLTGQSKDFSLSTLDYADKDGAAVSSSERKYYVTATDMNDIKKTVNDNVDSMSAFSSDLKEKIKAIDESIRNQITNEELDELMSKLGI